MHCSSQILHVNQVAIYIVINIIIVIEISKFNYYTINSADLKSNATSLTLSIVLPLLFLLILVSIIALAVYIAGWKIHHRKISINNNYNHVDKNNYGLTPLRNAITS